MRQLVAALGAAMIVGSIAVLIRERRREEGDLGPVANMKVVALNLVLGTILTLWGVASLIAASA